MSEVGASAGADEILVSFRGVQKSYDGENLIVKDLNLEIRKGEFLTLLGPSGSGKTTSLMMLAGFETPTAGEILLAGRSINNVPPHKRDIGMVFQNYALFPHMTVAENLGFPLSVRGLNRTDISQRVKRVLSMVQLDAFAQRYPAQLSGGQQQRVALARALVFEPQLVLMDEPLGALDKQLREHMQMEIKHLHQRLGVTVVYVTHDQGEALTMSDRVAVFHQGEIQQIAPPRMLYEEPKNTFVANFIGENNRLNGRLHSQDGDRCVVELSRGEKVQALAVNVGRTGDPVTLSIRPERISLNGSSESCANRFSGRVEEFIYLGDHVRVRLEVCGMNDFFVKQPIAELDPTLAVGDVVPLGWQVEHVRALDPLLEAN
ncbi:MULTISPECIES: ABC transporter ATP-binding protein [Pseudomonas]|jgi:putative spermidine/putrescine transport system ATP-binding protein|uniref:Spermidine/putrescine import ATP-binding protein PotA n=1 Tax=Pseudomonas psychrophila TaxID=122355 RepID=A0ABY0VJF0_9PSED|nr:MULTISPECIES: ABC transporter ATP-binding protein [Pseudomonas]EPJ95670.1 polyamine ABC transporter, ATP-binding protein [Pseudomonas psychrophila]KAB0488269.1 ABC transporter ATP-binding protein [Pseudomonas psychrophila]KMM97699.1 spermidine/putrescine ABC transporter ATP-binding protein [Pseudomonas psychrophila]KOX64106.1 spermidine/putrescine ABC transporter ATP-binding protein [Pseudomonas psychrophila]MDY7583388.1 ABC transporter ATP-binding protein [Pseudomonas sp. CCI3.1]